MAGGQVTTITTWTGPDGQPHPIPDEATAKKVKNHTPADDLKRRQ